VDHGHIVEATWEPHAPLRYDHAPIITNNSGYTDLLLLLSMADHVERGTPVGRFASKFRSRTDAIADNVAAEVLRVYDRSRTIKQNIADSYLGAMPYDPPMVTIDRRRAYERLLKSTPVGTRKCAC
jgi:hypothetical protein